MADIVKRFLFVIDTINNNVGRVVSFLALVMIGISAFEVIARFVFNSPTNWAFETVKMMFGLYIILGGGYVLFHKRHIRIDILWSHFSAKGRIIADLATSAFTFLLLGTMLWFGIRVMLHSIQLNEHSLTPFGPPIWPVKIWLTVGVFLILLQSIAKFIRDLHLAITGAEYD